MDNYYDNDNINDALESSSFKVILSLEEKIKCLEEIISRFKKILYVYDKSQEEETKYDYKVYCGGILIYVSSSNMLFEGELVNVVINLNAIINNDFDKAQIKRIVFESKNQLEFLLKRYRDLAQLDGIKDLLYDRINGRNPSKKED